MARLKVTMNSREIAKLLKSNDVSRGIDPMAQRVARRARATAPVSSGRYRDSITVESAVTDRVVKRIGSKVSYARKVEAETGNLARALDAAAG